MAVTKSRDEHTDNHNDDPVSIVFMYYTIRYIYERTDHASNSVQSLGFIDVRRCRHATRTTTTSTKTKTTTTAEKKIVQYIIAKSTEPEGFS